MSYATPALRPEIDAVPTRQQGEPVFVLYDRSGLSKAQLAVSPPVMFIISQLDGTTSILEIQDRYEKESGGDVLPSEVIEEVIQHLDDALFLHGERFEHYYTGLQAEFFASPLRPAISAGSAYSEDPNVLATELDEMMASAPPVEEHPPPGKTSTPPRGAIAPHIDYVRGAAGYGQLYRELASRKAPDVVIVIGTAHQPIRRRFAICPKGYATPLGEVPLARDLQEEIVRRTASIADFTEDAFAHRGEHSVELQAVWLRHIWGDRVPMLPVLAGSLEEFIEGNSSPSLIGQDPEIVTFTQTLRELLSEWRISPLILASADLAHVGPRFGDEREISEWFLEETEESDRTYLSWVGRGEAEKALEYLHSHKNRYHVCGAACIYALGTILPGVQGRLLGYHQAATPEMQQAVSYTAMIFD